MAEYTISDYDTAPEYVKAFFDTVRMFVPDVKFVAPTGGAPKSHEVYGSFAFTEVFKNQVNAGRVLAMHFLDQMPRLDTQIPVVLIDNAERFGKDWMNSHKTLAWRAYQ